MTIELKKQLEESFKESVDDYRRASDSVRSELMWQVNEAIKSGDLGELRQYYVKLRREFNNIENKK